MVSAGKGVMGVQSTGEVPSTIYTCLVCICLMFPNLTKPLGMQASVFAACPKPGKMERKGIQLKNRG